MRWREPGRRQRRAAGLVRSSAVIVVTGAMLLAACGSRRDVDELARASLIDVDRSSSPDGAPSGPASTSAVANGSLDSAPEGSGDAESAAAPLAFDRSPTPAAQAAVAAARGPAGDDRTVPTTSTGPRAEATGSPIHVGTVGNYSGIAGATFTGHNEALRAWAKDVNLRGGIGGHPVVLHVEDDHSDPSRHRSLVQKLVEERGVIAFVHNLAPLTGTASVAYLERVGVPVIGGAASEPYMRESPAFYPAFTNSPGYDTASVGIWAEVAIPAGETRFGVLVCTEAQACEILRRNWTAVAPRFGLEVVYEARASLAQPDFTAECLSARRAGVQIIGVSLDTNSMQRLAASCERQGYRPRLASAVLDVESFPLDPNMEGFIGYTSGFPWLADDTRARREFHRVLSREDVRPTPYAAEAWIAAKLFEHVALGLGVEPTAADVVAALDGVTNEDLGGLTPPLTFGRGVPRPLPACGAGVIVTGGGLQPVGGTEVRCF